MRVTQIFRITKARRQNASVADFIRGFTFDNNVPVEFAENQPLVSKIFINLRKIS